MFTRFIVRDGGAWYHPVLTIVGVRADGSERLLCTLPHGITEEQACVIRDEMHEVYAIGVINGREDAGKPGITFKNTSLKVA